ncbi:MAG TPA: hypothetical protein VMT16_02675, partial [Thermoanaerobaculia bacterium]|nr:hypothetical protein [Thermoanaerobaculia bacterium]
MRHRPPRSVLAAVCLALAPALAPPLAAADEPASGLHRWQVLIMGNPAGEMTAARQDDAWRVHFEFHDRGRGPALDATIRLAADGTPVAIAIDGVEYLKGAVAERFTRREGEASWESRSDAGEASVEGPAFYLSLDGTPFEGGLLAAALRLAPGHRLALLPGGEATLREVGRLEVTGPAGRRRLVHYEISGLGFTPQALWLDEGDAFFAAVSEWMSVVPEGYEDAVPGLLAAQEAEEAARYRRLATELGRRPQRGIAFTGAALFDADAGVVRPGMTVLVEGDRITAVGRDAAVAIPAGAEVVDASGSTLVPGLWDMHAHLSDRDGLLNVAAGVTTARDLANDTESLLERKRQWDAGEAIGPRVVLAGFMDGPGPFAGPTRVLVSTPDEARAAIDRYADSGHEQIKIYSSIDPQLVPAIAEHAHARGLRLSGHVPAFMTAEQAVRQGFDEIQHLNMLVLNFLPDVEDTRTPARFTAVAER